MGGRIDVTNQEVENLECQVIDNEHWFPLQSVVISLHNSLCWTCRGDGEPIPDRVRSASAPPSVSIAIPIPPPHTGRWPATPGPPPLSPVTDDDSSVIPDSSNDSSPNPFQVKCRTFQVAQGPEGLVWTDKERAVLQAFLSYYESKEGDNVAILEVGEGDRSPGGSRLLSEGGGFGEGGIGA